MDVDETRALAERVKAGIGQAIAKDREPTDLELSDVLTLLCGMAVNLAILAHGDSA